MEGCEEQLVPQLQRKKKGKGGNLQAKKAAIKAQGADVSDSSEEEDSGSCMDEDSPAESASPECRASRNFTVWRI